MELSDINLLDPDVFTEGVPHEWFTHLRNNAPVYNTRSRTVPASGSSRKHEDVGIVGRDAKTFSSAAKYGGVVGLEDPPTPEAKTELEAGRGDPGQHDAVHGSAGSHAVPQDRPRRVPSPDDLGPRGDDPRARGARSSTTRSRRAECDFVVDIAAELPLQAIAELLGVPMEDRHKLFDWSNRMIGSDRPRVRGERGDTSATRRSRCSCTRRSSRTTRKANPRDDIVTTLLAVRGRRPLAVGARLQPLLPAARRRRQRDDAQRDLPRHGGVPRQPRPVPGPRRRPVA